MLALTGRPAAADIFECDELFEPSAAA